MWYSICSCWFESSTVPPQWIGLCAIDCMSVVTALGLSAYTVFTGRIIYLDIALVDAILGFISTVFVSRYLEGRL